MSFSKKNGVDESRIKKYFSIPKRKVRYLSQRIFKRRTNVYNPSPYNFETETTSEGTTTQWSPSSSYNTWANGSDAVNGTYWGLTSNKTVAGWDLATDSTPSSQTGWGVLRTLMVAIHAGNRQLLIYRSFYSQNTRCFVVRTPPLQFGDLISYVGNNLRVEFYVHAYGSQQHDLYVYLSTATTSNHSSATLLETFTHSHSGSNNGGTSTLTKSSDRSTYDFTNNSNWQKVEVNLNSYKDDDNTYYIYFVAQNGTGFRADICIDEIKVCEESVK